MKLFRELSENITGKWVFIQGKDYIFMHSDKALIKFYFNEKEED